MKKSCCPAESAVRPDNKFKVIQEEPVTDIVCLGKMEISVILSDFNIGVSTSLP